jgi:nitrite reductase (NADH) small subunit
MSSDPPRSSLFPPHLSSKTSLLPTFGQGDSPSTLRWVEVCDEDEVLVEGLYPYDVDRDEMKYPILIIRTHKSLYALHDECPHRRVSLSEKGYLDGDVVHCGWHHWGFKVESGAHTIPTGVCVGRFDLKIEEGRVSIGLPW